MKTTKPNIQNNQKAKKLCLSLFVHFVFTRKNRTDYDKNTYYLFLIDKSEKGILEGIMPYRENFGYIFANTTSGSQKKQFRAIAHELGDGAFDLEHNFSERGTRRSKTPNLMDYSKTGGTVLRKYQWEFIHNPKMRIFGGDEDEVASEATTIVCFYYDEFYPKPKLFNLLIDDNSYDIQYMSTYNNAIKRKDINYTDSYFFKIGEEIDMDKSYIDNGVKIEITKNNYIRINSPFSIYKLSDGFTYESINYQELYRTAFKPWVDENWGIGGFYGVYSKMAARQEFASASLIGGYFDLSFHIDLKTNSIYRISEDAGNGYTYDTYYNKDEMRYWFWGYVVSQMDLTYHEAIAGAMQYFNKERLVTFNESNKLQDFPWFIDAMLDGYWCRWNKKNKEPIAMYSPYGPRTHEGEFDINTDLGLEVLDLVYTIGSGSSLVIGKEVVKAGVRFSTAAVVDWMIQAFILHMEKENLNFSDALWLVDFNQVMYSGAEANIGIGQRYGWLKQATVSSVRILTQDALKKGEWDEETLDKVVKTVGINLLISLRIPRTNKYLLNLLEIYKKQPEKTKRKIYNLITNRSLADWVIARIANEDY